MNPDSGPAAPPPEKGRYLQLLRQGGVAHAVGLQPEAALPLLHFRFKLLQQFLQQEGLRVKEGSGGPAETLVAGASPAPRRTASQGRTTSLRLGGLSASSHWGRVSVLLPAVSSPSAPGTHRVRIATALAMTRRTPRPHRSRHFDQFSCWSRLVSK